MKKSLIYYVFLILALSIKWAFAELPKDVVKGIELNGGLVVQIHCGDGRDLASLNLNRNVLVHGLDTDIKKVDAARNYIQSQGLYGRITVNRFNGKNLPYINNLVNIIIAEYPGDVSLDEIMRVLAPRGVVYIKTKGTWEKKVKPWPNDLDEWTHWLHGPDNNAVSKDKKVGISRNMQWSMPPIWSRHHNLLPSMSTLVTAKGRLFYIIDDAPVSIKGLPDRWVLVARDAFNGMLLWKKPINEWGWKVWSEDEFAGFMRFKAPSQLFKRVVANKDTVYTTLGFTAPVVAIDAETGKMTKTYKGTENTSEILYHDGLLVLAKNVLEPEPGKEVLVVNAETGKILWEKKGFKGVSAHGDELKKYTDIYLTVGDNKVFFLNQDYIEALDMKTGKQVWKQKRPEVEKDVFGHNDYYFGDYLSLVYKDKMLFLGQIYPKAQNLNKWQVKDMILRAMDSSTGKTIWDYKGATIAHFTPPDLLITKGLVWILKDENITLLGLDYRTGKIKKEYPAKEILVGHHHRCYRNKATEQFYFYGEEGIEYIDFKSGEIDVHHWLRGACRYGIMPANGMIYLPTHHCGCHIDSKLSGFIAMTSDPFPEIRIEENGRLFKGPAYQKKMSSKKELSQKDWPVFRHDYKRSNFVPVNLPEKLSKKWSVKVGGDLTPLIIADNKIFLASKSDHVVYCLDGVTGKKKWQFVTDGSIDSPPAYYRGRIFFGSRGGSVYSLNADDGQLVWKRFVALYNLRQTSYGSLESVWPVQGSVVVMNDKVYCVAGRSMHLNSGLYMYMLDADSGAMLQQSHLTPDLEKKGELGEAVLPDILVVDEGFIYMKKKRINPDNITETKNQKTKNFFQVNASGLLDGTWFNSNFWTYGKTSAQMLTFNDTIVVGMRAYKKMISKSYGQDIFTAGEGYKLFANDLNAKPVPVVQEEKETSTKKKKKKRKKKKIKEVNIWMKDVPLRAKAMVLTDQNIFIAGVPDVIDPKDPWAAVEGRKGSLLNVFSKNDGTRKMEYEFSSVPVYDGMAVANESLYIVFKDGTISCMKGMYK